MTEKVCLVTGGSSGVGRSIAAACARAGATVLIVSSDLGRGQEAAQALRASSGNPKVESFVADLSVMSSVRALAAAFQRRFRALHVLSMNAAALHFERRVTPDGYEAIFAANYLGHFLLTNLLMDRLKAGAPSRVLAASGAPGSLRALRLDMDDLMLEKGFNAFKATTRAALAKALFMFELARRAEGTGVTANTFHPGFVRSSLPAKLPWFMRLPVRLAMALASTESDTGNWLATSPEAEGLTGKFVVKRQPASFTPGYDVAEAGARLWEASAKLVGIP
jgi:NAD(P)-dependent dehydrogenase (short-subunit alcohol dehydrogenase family)